MKAEELMIGDWVCYSIPNKYYTKIQEIRCTQDGEEYYIRCHRDAKDTFLEQLKYDDFSVDIIHPIPLTPEILEKNGFTFNKEETNSSIQDVYENYTKFFDFPLGKGYYIEYDTVKKVFYITDHCWIIFKYVHELQHALRLCDIDKEIVL